MHSIELEKAYNPASFEDRIYRLWEESGAFQPGNRKWEIGNGNWVSTSDDHRTTGQSPGSPATSQTNNLLSTSHFPLPYTITIPPPNVTGVLHLGHALNMALQDIVIRYHRMAGDAALWVPGTDHAGIATQNVVERRLRTEGKNRRDMGREAFVERTWEVKKEHHEVITRQMRRMGVSVDWSRERFTLDEGLSRAVREVFCTLYERGLLYKGTYLVNWCSSCGTALSDDEVEHEDTKGKMYHIRYEVVGEEGAPLPTAGSGFPLQFGAASVQANNNSPLPPRISATIPSAGFRESGIANRESTTGSEVAADPRLPTPDSAETSECIPPFPKLPTFIEIATTRPETLLGDTAVAVHPEDERYAALVGKRVKLPLTDRTIPVIADAYVDRAFGTGVVKITPAHDPNDWEVGKRHGLEVINILTPDGRLNDAVPEKYRGLSVAAAREAVIADLTEQGLFIRAEDITHAVGHCYRCHTVIEPYQSEQWFVRMKPLAEKALAAWRAGEIVFYPRKWENTYRHWLENIRDWCVSRQLWWGHRIPAWYCASCGKTSVSRDDLTSCPHCGSLDIKQDEDVLDTWFSSWLWPFSTLGWPEESADFSRFYPTTALITAYDILFFWVSRMIMAGLEFTGRAPFRDVYIHGLVRDKQGRKMSKSLGNGIDPLELVDEYGADALKFTLAFLCAQGQDILIDRESFKLGSKFANKVWNASRYILLNLEGRNLVEKPALTSCDRWIYSRLAAASETTAAALRGYRYNEAASCVYEFFWNDFCDWYVEATKLSTRGEAVPSEKDRALTVLLDVLSLSLRLLHPFLPFVTEEIWSKLGSRESGNLLISSPWPVFSPETRDAALEGDFAFLQEITRGIRTLRSEAGIAPEKKLRVEVRAADERRRAFVEENAALVVMLAGLSAASFSGAADGDAVRPAGSLALAGAGFEAFVFVAGAVDIAALKAKFTKSLEKDKGFIGGLTRKLENEAFLKNAPPELVAGEKAKLEEARERVGKLEAYIKGL